MGQVDLGALPFVIGWFHAECLEQMVHREWLVSETNEFTPLAHVLDGLESLRAARAVTILGSGLGRFASYLHERYGIERVVNSDLAFPAVYFGRMLAQGRGVDLPDSLRRARTFVSVAEGNRLILEQTPNEYLTLAAADVAEYQVIDACRLIAGVRSGSGVCAVPD